jgi:hypothetical protein
MPVLPDSPPGSLTGNDWKKIGKGAAIAILAAVLTVITDTLPQVDLGPTWGPVVMAGWSIAVNTIRKLLTLNKP